MIDLYCLISYTVIDNLTHKWLKETTIRSRRNTTFRTHKNTFVHHRLPIAFYNLRKTFLISPDLSHGKLFHGRRNSFQEFQQKTKEILSFSLQDLWTNKKKERKFASLHIDTLTFKSMKKYTKNVERVSI